MSLSTVGDSSFVIISIGAINNVFQNGLELINLFLFGDHVNGLLNILVGDQCIDLTDIDLNGILKEIVCQLLNLLWPSSRKEKCLSSGSISLLDNRTNLWFETL